jgi:hypothetical protein
LDTEEDNQNGSAADAKLQAEVPADRLAESGAELFGQAGDHEVAAAMDAGRQGVIRQHGWIQIKHVDGRAGLNLEGFLRNLPDPKYSLDISPESLAAPDRWHAKPAR